jgi:hypothetical protein
VTADSHQARDRRYQHHRRSFDHGYRHDRRLMLAPARASVPTHSGLSVRVLGAALFTLALALQMVILPPPPHVMVTQRAPLCHDTPVHMERWPFTHCKTLWRGL